MASPPEVEAKKGKDVQLFCLMIAERDIPEQNVFYIFALFL